MDLDFPRRAAPFASLCLIALAVGCQTPSDDEFDHGDADVGRTGAALTGTALLDVNLSVTPTSRFPNETTRLAVRLFNASTMGDAVDVTFTDVLPDNVFVQSPANISNSCGGTVTPTNTAARGEFTLVGGTIPVASGGNQGECIIELDVYASTAGSYTNSIAADDVQGTVNGMPVCNAQNTDATFTAAIPDIEISAVSQVFEGTSVSASTMQTGPERMVITFRLTNPSAAPLTGVAINPSNFSTVFRIVPGSSSTTCGGTLDITDVPPISPTAFTGHSNWSLSGGTIAASGSCEITLTVESTRREDYFMGTSRGDLILLPGDVTSAEGGVNGARFARGVSSAAGVMVEPQINGSSSTSINLNDTTTVEVRYLFRSRNLDPVSGYNFSNTLPAGLSFDSVVSNTCGGAAGGSGTSVTLTGATLDGPPPNVNGAQTEECALTVRVAVAAEGSYTVDVPAGDLAGRQYQRRLATLTVTGGLLQIVAVYDQALGHFRQGDVLTKRITIRNRSDVATGVNVSDLHLTDELETNYSAAAPVPLLWIDDREPARTTCMDATLVAAPGTTTITLSDATLPAGAECEIVLPVRTSTQFWERWGNRHDDTIDVGDVTFDTPTQDDVVFSTLVTAQLGIRHTIDHSASFVPARVAPLGRSRLQLRIRHDTRDLYSLVDLAHTATLTDGITVAPSPNVLSECGGTVTATPGDTTVQLTGGRLDHGGAVSVGCSIYLDVLAPALTPPALVGLGYVRQNGGAPFGSGPWDTTANREDAHPLDPPVRGPFTRIRQLQWEGTALTAGTSFLPVSINGGTASRARIEIVNASTNAIDLTGVSVTDALPGDLRLFSNVAPAFTNTSGTPNAGGCAGGTFTFTPGANTITLSNAEVDAGATCWFEFNVTARVGGNHINSVEVGDITSFEGVTNNNSASATLTVLRQINVGLGFDRPVVAVGEDARLLIEIYNTREMPNDETGASPALIDVLPAGLSIQSVASNSCGGTVTTGTMGGQDYVQLDGGDFIAESSCVIAVDVTASVAGPYTDEVARGDLRTVDNNTNADDAAATVFFIERPRIAKAFATPMIGEGGTSQVVFTLNDPNPSGLGHGGITGIAFSDPLVDMVVASPPGTSNNCGGVVNAVPGSNLIEVTGAAINPGSSCAIRVNVTSTVVGEHPNATSTLAADQTVTPSPGSNTANLRVVQAPTLAKSFTPVGLAGSMLTFTLTNPNPVDVALSNPAFSDPLPLPLAVASPLVVTNDCGSTLRNMADTANLAAGDTGIRVEGGTVPAGDACTITVNIAVDQPGEYVNVTSPLRSAGGESAPAMATLTAEGDHGDAPVSYGDPIHLVVAGLHLGATAPDGDTGAQPSPGADGDDVNGADDEDGLAASLVPRAQAHVVNVPVTGPGRLQAFVDWDGDGSFQAAEQIATDLQDDGAGSDTAAGDGVIQLAVSAPATAVNSPLARLRWSRTAGLDAVGLARDGEVEDHALSVVECVDNSHCGGTTPLCDPSSNTCVQCLGAADCNDGIECTADQCTSGVCANPTLPVGTACSTGVCDGEATPLCVPCVDTNADTSTDAGCAAGAPLCVPDATTGVPACVACTDDATGGDTDFGCAAGTPLCDTSGSAPACTVCIDTAASGQDDGCAGDTPLCDDADTPRMCVGCIADTDCAAGFICDPSQTCVAGCRDDSGCTGTPDTPLCDTSSNSCVACLGASDCDDGNECTLDECNAGSCSNGTLAAGTACTGGICDGEATPMCVVCADTMTGAAVDLGCSAPAPLCVTDPVSSSLRCVACTDDASGDAIDLGCEASGPVCDTSGAAPRCEVCIRAPMASDDDGCMGETPLCDDSEMPRMCVGCLGDDDCPAGAICGPSQTCAPGCRETADCAGTPETPVCDTDAEACVECIADTQCEADAVCSPERTCVECNTGTDCAEGQVCHPGSDSCVECVGDADCAEGLVCADATCQPECASDMDCTDPAASVCDAGVCVGCTRTEECGEGLICADRACLTPCTDASECGTGQPVCDLSGAGVCVECTDNTDCASGSCDPVTRRCLPGCTEATECPGDRPMCDATGRCVACQDDGPCGPEAVCDVDRGLCVECTDDAQCLEGESCHQGTCRGCADDSECSAPSACDPDLMSCEGECATDAQCDNPRLSRCLLESMTCTECLNDSDCQDNEVCNGAMRCEPPCTDTSCAEGRLCDMSDGQCVGCIDDDSCSDGQSCHPSTRECVDGCVDDGDCPDGVCESGMCAACREDSDCPMGERCDTASQTCTSGCMDDSDCADASLPYCVEGMCEACTPTMAGMCVDSVDGMACVEGDEGLRCGCESDSDCGLRVCDTETRVCTDPPVSGGVSGGALCSLQPAARPGLGGLVGLVVLGLLRVRRRRRR